MVGPHAGDMIGEVTLPIEMGAEAVDIGKTIHPQSLLTASLKGTPASRASTSWATSSVSAVSGLTAVSNEELIQQLQFVEQGKVPVQLGHVECWAVPVQERTDVVLVGHVFRWGRRARLADPAQLDLPVLTLALVSWSSFARRAFLEQVGWLWTGIEQLRRP